jgi:hypothetical protein
MIKVWLEGDTMGGMSFEAIPRVGDHIAWLAKEFVVTKVLWQSGAESVKLTVRHAPIKQGYPGL